MYRCCTEVTQVKFYTANLAGAKAAAISVWFLATYKLVWHVDVFYEQRDRKIWLCMECIRLCMEDKGKERELPVNFVHQGAERIELETWGGFKGEYWWLAEGGITVLY